MHLEDKLEDSNKNSILRDIFYTKLAEVYTCKHCGTERRVPKTQQVILTKGDVTENLNDLSRDKDCDVERSCDRCQTKRRFTEKTVIESPPHVLQISLQSEYDSRETETSQFPECVNIRPHMEDARGSNVVYRLYALVRGGRHYFAYCKSPGGQWNKYDDGEVTKVQLNDVLKKNPFSLYYVRSPGLDGDWDSIDEAQKIKALQLKKERENDSEMKGSVLERVLLFVYVYLTFCLVHFIFSKLK